MCSSAATLATPSGMPMPRFTTLSGRSSIAARRAMTFRSVSSSGGTVLRTRRSSPLNAAEYGVPKVCQWCSGCETTTQSTRIPGIFTSRGLRLPLSATRSTCTITRPPALCTAVATASASMVSASRSMVMFPSGSAVVPRRNATSSCSAL